LPFYSHLRDRAEVEAPARQDLVQDKDAVTVQDEMGGVEMDRVEMDRVEMDRVEMDKVEMDREEEAMAEAAMEEGVWV
jgi:hypothetical protein